MPFTLQIISGDFELYSNHSKAFLGVPSSCTLTARQSWVGLLDLLVPVNSLKRSIAMPFFFVSSASLLLIFDIHTEKKSRVFKKLCVVKIRLACACCGWVWEVSTVCAYILICRSCWIESWILFPLFSSLKSSSLVWRISSWMICSNGIESGIGKASGKEGSDMRRARKHLELARTEETVDSFGTWQLAEVQVKAHLLSFFLNLPFPLSHHSTKGR